MKKFNKKNIEDIFALTPMQEGMLFHYLKDPKGDHYFEQLSLKITGEINLQRFKKAWDYVVQGSDMLRTFFRWEKLDSPAQVVLKQHNPDLGFFDLSDIEDHAKQQKQLEKIKLEDRKEKFDLREVPFRVILCKISGKDYHIVISNHHILYDGWSSGIILKEFFRVYAGLEEGETSLVLPVKPSFKEFVRWHQNRDKDKQKKFWEEYFKGFDTQTRLPIKRKSVKINKVPGGTPVKEFGFTLEKGISDRLDTFLKKHRITLAAFFYCSWGILLQKYCNSDDIVFGTTVSGRSAPINGIENMVGLFINTLPLRVTAKTGETVLDLLLKVNVTLAHREKHENTPLVDIREYSRRETSQELFDSLLVMENYPLDLPLIVDSYSANESTNYDLTIVIALHQDIEVRLLYTSELFGEDLILRLSRHFIHALKAITAHPQKQFHEIEILSREERKQLLVDFNDTNKVSGYPREKSIHRLFEEQVERTPDHTALLGQIPNSKSQIPNKEAAFGGNVSITYKELNEKTDQLAYLLKEKGILEDSIVGIMVERSVEMIIGILGILKAGGAYLPIDPQYPEERKQYMLNDSSAKILLTRQEIAGLSSPEAFNNSPKGTPSFGIFNRLGVPPPLEFGISPRQGGHLAYIIYTSGSTGEPKGVMVEHCSVINLLFALHHQYPLKKPDTYLLKTSYLFDVSVTELFGWFLEGARLAVLEKGGEKDPKAILDKIEQEKITHINFVPSMFNVFVAGLHKENIGKLSGLKYMLLAGETLLPGTVNRFQHLNTGVVLENIYGPTEAAVYASWYSVADWKGEGSIPIGKPLPNVRLYIFDRYGRLQPISVPGELCISGVGLARGYLNRPELTNEKFLSVPSMSSVAKKIYKTGDLARWLPHGNIEFLGRKDYQVKIRGFRIELGEIENQLLSHPGIEKAVVAAAADESGDHLLCAYVVPYPMNALDALPLRQYLRQKLPDYMIPAYFVTLDQIPLTATGKVDRKSLPQPRVVSPKKYAVPGNQLEAELVDIWAEVLGIDNKQIGINDNFFELGGHSLKVAGLTGRIHKKLNIEVPFNKIFQAPTVKDLAQYISQKEESQYCEIPLAEEKEYYPLSSAQKRLFVLQQMEVDCTAYNICGIMDVEGPVEKEKFGLVFRQLISRHESLRTSFQIVEEQPVQKTHDEVEFEIEYYDAGRKVQSAKRKEERHALCAMRFASTLKNFIRPFDLSEAPLLRVGLIKKENEKHLLMVDMHHIISDGTSVNVLMKDFAALYEGEKLPALGIQYKEFSEWQNSSEEREKIKEQEAFWLKEFAGEIPILNLPTDYSRSVIQDFEGCTVGFEIPAEQVRLLKELAADTRITLYMLFLALYNILLSKISGQTDIVVGTPMALRHHGDLERIVGMFVNTLALRNFPNQDKSLEEFLLEVKERTLDAFANQDYPYEDIVEGVAVDRNTGRNPLFDTMFALHEMNAADLEIHHLRIKPYENENNTSKFDLSLIVTEIGENLLFAFEYSIKLFRKETIERFISYFKQVVSSVLEDTQKKISEIEIITGNELRQILEVFNHPALEYPRRTVMDLFEEQVEKKPGSTACFDDVNYLTFEELNNRTNVLANIIKEL